MEQKKSGWAPSSHPSILCTESYGSRAEEETQPGLELEYKSQQQGFLFLRIFRLILLANKFYHWSGDGWRGEGGNSWDRPEMLHLCHESHLPTSCKAWTPVLCRRTLVKVHFPQRQRDCKTAMELWYWETWKDCFKWDIFFSPGLDPRIINGI